ncbi:MAG: DUF1175 family protein, partial [Blastocatellia bacterium]|nr:DUF1175 family protein [Blastocatellia bacterium]
GYQDWVVYHTGSQLTNGSPQNLAVVKKVRLAELKEHPDYRWHPVKSNPSFLGFYRLKLIDN